MQDQGETSLSKLWAQSAHWGKMGASEGVAELPYIGATPWVGPYIKDVGIQNGSTMYRKRVKVV